MRHEAPQVQDIHAFPPVLGLPLEGIIDLVKGLGEDANWSLISPTEPSFNIQLDPGRSRLPIGSVYPDCGPRRVRQARGQPIDCQLI